MRNYPSSTNIQRDSINEPNDARNKAIIQKQNDQLSKLKSHFVKLRNLYHDERKDFAMKSISYQQAIEHTKRKIEKIEYRINEIKTSIQNEENEKYANELIEQIWFVLKSFRKEIFDDAGEKEPNSENSFSVANAQDSPELSNQFNQRKSVSYAATANIAKRKSGAKTQKKSPDQMEIISDAFDSDQPFSSPIDTPINDGYHLQVDITPSSNTSEIMTPSSPDFNNMTPIPSASNHGSNKSDIEMISQFTDGQTVHPIGETQFCDSIAMRRTRRKCSTNVYYKEPSLREALTPGDPFTFSIEDGMVTPTIPNHYDRNTPTVNTKKKYRRK